MNVLSRFTKRVSNPSKFKKTKFLESSAQLVNPERGWYQIHTFVLGEEISLIDREYTLNQTDTLAFVLVDISAYRNCPLDDRALGSLREIFTFFRDYRLDMILRVVYDTVGKCMETEPEEESFVHGHMRQLGPLIKEFSNEIFVYQGLLIGNWGEMHSSKFLSPSRLRKLSAVILEELEGQAYLAVRRPVYVRLLYPEGEDLRQNRVGIFDDAILASPTHLGTFGNEEEAFAKREHSWNPAAELSYVSELCDRVPYGGEVLWADEEDGLEKTRTSLKLLAQYFRQLHVVYLNRVHDIRFLSNLRQLTWNGHDVFRGMNGYDYVERHLGYRLWIKDVSCAPFPQNPEILDWRIHIENVGFSRVFFESLVLLEGYDELGNVMQEDVSSWMQLSMVGAGESHEFHVQTKPMYGRVTLYAAKKSTRMVVHFANKRQSDWKPMGIYLGEFQ